MYEVINGIVYCIENKGTAKKKILIGEAIIDIDGKSHTFNISTGEYELSQTEIIKMIEEVQTLQLMQMGVIE